jgi:NADH:ubiquinone reductase (H+-translocating)
VERLPHVVVIGAGFAGLNAARALRDAPVSVTLIDARNHHTFQPLLYQVATAGLEAEEVAYPVRGIFQKQRNLRFLMARVTGIDLPEKRIRLDTGVTVTYDYLVLAAGAISADFGVAGVSEHALTLKTLDDAVRMRGHIIRQFELADANPGLIQHGALHVVVAGGGPTGVEMAGALIELFDHVLTRDFPAIRRDDMRVTLVENGGRLLAPFHAALSESARRALERRGVTLRFNDGIAGVDAGGVTLKSGERISAQTVIWSAGVRANPLASLLGVAQTRGGRLVVKDDLSLPDHPEVFAVGDIAAGAAASGGAYPQLARPAMQSGTHAARQIERRLHGDAPQPFVYHDPGTMATIGRNDAVVQFPIGLRLSGVLGWLVWVFLHLMMLVGFRNRLNVFVNWAYTYLTYDRGARLTQVPALNTLRSRNGTAA